MEATLMERVGARMPETLRPHRTDEQMLSALRYANEVRSRRAAIKVQLKSGDLAVTVVLLSVDREFQTWKVFDVLQAAPKYGRVKAARVMNQVRISQSKTVGGLSERQRAELCALLTR